MALSPQGVFKVPVCFQRTCGEQQTDSVLPCIFVGEIFVQNSLCRCDCLPFTDTVKDNKSWLAPDVFNFLLQRDDFPRRLTRIDALKARAQQLLYGVATFPLWTV